MNEKDSSAKTSQSPETTRFYWIWGILIGVLLAITGAAIYQWHEGGMGKVSKKMPVYGRLPNFQFTERNGKPFGSKDLHGKIWVADFIFTRCAGPCPIMSANMARFQTSLQKMNRVKLVSFSVDPEYDSPKVLTEYAKYYHAKENQWFFLTGDRDAIRKLARESFKLTVERNAARITGDDANDILHSAHFILVDGQSRIRGYYDSSSPTVLQRVLADIKILLAKTTDNS